MPTYEAIVSVVDRSAFIRDLFQARNHVFAKKVRIGKVPGDPRLVVIESEDYLCVEDALIVELNMSVEEAKALITIT